MAGMATLTVWRFDSPYGARNALDLVERLRKEALLQLDDAAIVAWPDDRKKPKTEQLRSMAGMGALTGSFWGLLYGLLFFVPLLGMAVGAAFGALGGSLADVGIATSFRGRSFTRRSYSAATRARAIGAIVLSGLPAAHALEGLELLLYARQSGVEGVQACLEALLE
jgi:Protein of unknown function (DUF1269)